jgi:N-acetylmuramoyl-L-alanine amidase
MKVFFSVGHDAKRKGAYNEKYNIYEYDVCVELTQYCIEEAMELGLDCEKVYSDRLGKAIEEVNQRCNRNDLAIEVHINSIAAQHADKVHGCEVEYCVGSVRGKKLARQVQDSMLAHLGQRNCKNDARDDLGFLEKTKCTAIIPEPFFLSNDGDVEKFLLKDREAKLRNLAKVIAIGVFAFIREEEQND